MDCLDTSVSADAPERYKTLCKVRNALNDIQETAITRASRTRMVAASRGMARVPIG